MADSDSGLFGAVPRQTKGVILGGLFIAWGIIGAFVSYVSDSDSFDIIRMLGAERNAILHAVIWTVAGACVIAWYTIGPGGSRWRGADDDGERNAEWMNRNQESEGIDQRP